MKYIPCHIFFNHINENLFIMNTMSKWDDFITFDKKKDHIVFLQYVKL